MGYSQERLEHLGDAVLQLCITHLLFKKYPNESEGILTKMRTKIVNGATLAQIGRRMNIDNLVVVSKIAENALSHDRLYEDTFEALVGAVYLDLGLQDCMTFVAYHVENEMDSDTLLCDTNYKDLLRKSVSKRKCRTCATLQKVMKEYSRVGFSAVTLTFRRLKELRRRGLKWRRLTAHFLFTFPTRHKTISLIRSSSNVSEFSIPEEERVQGYAVLLPSRIICEGERNTFLLVWSRQEVRSLSQRHHGILNSTPVLRYFAGLLSLRRWSSSSIA